MVILTDEMKNRQAAEALANLITFTACGLIAPVDGQMGISTHTLQEVIDPAPHPTTDEIDFIQGLDTFFEAFAGDMLFGASAAVLVAVGSCVYAGVKSDPDPSSQFTPEKRLELAAFYASTFSSQVAAKAFAYACAKTLLTMIVPHAITALGPAAHVILAITFAVVYAAISTYFQALGEYQAKKHTTLGKLLYADPLAKKNLPTFSSLSDFMRAEKKKFRRVFLNNLWMGLGLYGSSLIPGFNWWESLLTSSAVAAAPAAVMLFSRKSSTTNDQLNRQDSRKSSSVRYNSQASTAQTRSENGTGEYICVHSDDLVITSNHASPRLVETKQLRNSS